MAGFWSEKYELNIKDIDAQHKQYFGYLESTDAIIAQDELAQDDVFKIMRLMMSLRNYGFLHFHTEEKLMIDVGYPESLAHLDLHDEFLSKMSAYRLTFLGLFKEFKAGAANQDAIKVFLREFVDYVTKWFQIHISKEDAKYAYFIKHK